MSHFPRWLIARPIDRAGLPSGAVDRNTFRVPHR